MTNEICECGHEKAMHHPVHGTCIVGKVSDRERCPCKKFEPVQSPETKPKWKAHLPDLLRVIDEETNFHNPLTIRILKTMLSELAFRCSEINDPKLNAIMCRLALYEISDPYSKEYDAKLTEEIIKNG